MKKVKLASKIYRPVFIFSLVSFSLVILLTLMIVKDEVDRRLLSQFRNTLDVFASSVRDDLINGLDKEIHRKCNALLQDPSVTAVQVSRDSGNICLSDIRRSKGTLLKRSLFFDEAEKFEAGMVQIVFSTDLYGVILLRIVFLLFFSIAFVATTYWVFSIFFVKRETQAFTDLAEDLAKEDFSELRKIRQKYPQDHSAEFQTLCEGIESLVGNWYRLQEEIIKSETLKAKHEMARFIAHDIKSPLSAIKVVGEILGQKPEKAKDLLIRSTERIESMLVDIMKGQPNDLTSKSRFEIEDFVEELVRSVRLSSGDLLDLEVVYASEVLKRTSLTVDRKLLFRSLENLLKNAFEAKKQSQPRAKVVMEINEVKGLICFKVTDWGQGIAASILDRLGQEEVSFGKASGTGIGLYQVKKFCESSDGQFQISSTVGEMTCVEVRFPKALG